MAKQTITRILDDLTGDVADETVHFAVDGNLYEIDLTHEHAVELREHLGKFITAGTRIGRVGQGPTVQPHRPTTTTSAASNLRSSRAENHAIREWADRNGFGVAERGRIPQHVVDAYQNRHHTQAAVNRAAVKDEQGDLLAAPPASKPPASKPKKTAGSTRSPFAHAS